MRRFVLRAVLGLYPRVFRQRYGQELQDLLDDLHGDGQRSSARIILSLVAGAAEERAGGFRAPKVRLATVAVVAAALAAVAFVSVSASSDGTASSTSPQLQASAGPQPVTPNGSQVSYGNPGPQVEQQLQADIRTLCTQIAPGKHATAVAVDPITGTILGKIVRTCSGSA